MNSERFSVKKIIPRSLSPLNIWALSFGEFDTDIENIFGNVIDKLSSDGLIAVDENHIRLTERGMKFGNIVFAEFLMM